MNEMCMVLLAQTHGYRDFQPSVEEILVLGSTNSQIQAMMLVKNQHLHEIGGQKSYSRFD